MAHSISTFSNTRRSETLDPGTTQPLAVNIFHSFSPDEFVFHMKNHYRRERGQENFLFFRLNINFISSLPNKAENERG